MVFELNKYAGLIRKWYLWILIAQHPSFILFQRMANTFFLSNAYCDSMRPKVCNDSFMNVRRTLTVVNIDRKKCILFIVSIYIVTVSKKNKT